MEPLINISFTISALFGNIIGKSGKEPHLVLKEIKKLQPLNYNQFKWWRRFDTKNKPLPKGATFFNK